MSNKTKHALVGTLGRGRNTNINNLQLNLALYSSVKTESAFVYSYCFLLTELF